jgi:hypothetical protein
VPNFFTFNVFTLSGSEQGTFVFRCFLWKWSSKSRSYVTS